MKRKNHGWAIGYSIVLILYTGYILLDAFVIPSNLVSVEQDVSGSSVSAAEDSSSAVITDTTYKSENISIEISTLTEYETQIYVADIILSDISSLKTGLAQGTFGRNIKENTSEIAEENQAILAINGDYYGFRNSGFVLRNGYLYRTTARNGSMVDALVIEQDGSFRIVDETESDAQSLAGDGALQIFSFGPGLVTDGEICVTSEQENEWRSTSNPRTAIGMVGALHYKFVVSDGRTNESNGLSLQQLADVMKAQGCETAYNLDGGGSSTMWFCGTVINKPTTSGRSIHERSVSDIVYIG